MDIVSTVKNVYYNKVTRRAQLELLQAEIKFIKTRLDDLVYPDIDVNVILHALKDGTIPVDDASFVLNITHDGNNCSAPLSTPLIMEVSSDEITELFDPLITCIHSVTNMPSFKAPSKWELNWTYSCTCWMSSVKIKTQNKCDICAYLMIRIDDRFAVLAKIERTNTICTWYTKMESEKYKLIVVNWSNTDEWVMTINIE